MAEIKIVANDKDYTNRVSNAVKFFWNTKKRQLKDSGDASNRGAVDLWTAFREGQFPHQQAPWIGWL
jgi:hypothetical protein